MYRSSDLIESRKVFLEKSRNSFLIYAVYDAVVDADLTTLTYLLTVKNVNPNVLIPEYDAAPFHVAAGIGSEEHALRCVNILLSHGANPNIMNSDGTTPLMISCLWGRQSVIRLLLNYGANPFVEDVEGKNSFDYALESDQEFAYRILKEFQNDVTYRGLENTITCPNDKINNNFVSSSDDLKQNKNLFSDIDSDANVVEFYSLNAGFRESYVSYINQHNVPQSSNQEVLLTTDSSETNNQLENITGRNEKYEVFHDCNTSNKATDNNDHDLNHEGEDQIILANENSDSSLELISAPKVNLIQRDKTDDNSLNSDSHISVVSYATDHIREELKRNHVAHGPVTKTTKRVYQNLLSKITKREHVPVEDNRYSSFPEVLRSTFKENFKEFIRKWYHLEQSMSANFSNVNRDWRGGKEKQFFTYLLLDPFVTDNLPQKRDLMTEVEIWQTFLLSIFYVGKGKNSRPFSHLYEALRTMTKKTVSKKVTRIQKIWDNSAGVICLHLFHNTISAEAHTREAAMIDALGSSNLTNIQSGEYYGLVKTWSIKQKQQLGTVLLYKALQIYLAEGERQIYSTDLS